MADEQEEQKHRLYNRKKSDAAKIAWKKYRANYMRGIRKKEREMTNKSFYDIAQDLNKKLSEAKIIRNNEFDRQLDIAFDTIAGGVSLSIEDNNVSFSVALNENGSGAYASVEISDTLFTELGEELMNVCNMVDKEMQQILAKHGLKPTA